MSKNKFIKNTLIFCLLTSITLFSITKFIDYRLSLCNYDYTGKINKVIKNKLEEEITIWGASTAYVNIIPEIIEDSTGKTAFNMGLDGTNIDQYGGLLENYITNQSNKTIIIALDIHGGLMKRKSPYRLYNWLHVINNDLIYQQLKTIDSSLFWKIKYLPFYKLIYYGKHNIRNIIKPVKELHYLEKGFKPNFGKFKSNTHEAKISFANNKNVFNYLDKICKSGIKHNHKMIVVLTPCHKKGLESGDNKDLIIHQLQQLQNKNVTLLNFVDDPMNNFDEYFKDNTHLNQKGANLFSNKLGKELKNLLK